MTERTEGHRRRRASSSLADSVRFGIAVTQQTNNGNQPPLKSRVGTGNN